MKPTFARSVIARSLAVLAISVAAPSAFAGSYTVQGGSADGISRFSLGYTADPIWTSSNGNWQIVPVYELARFHQSFSHDTTLYQVSAVPMFRYNINSLYLEAGIGLSLFNHTRIADKNISTAFQFSDHIGIGYRVTPNFTVGYRFSHFSNASIKQPNPGINANAIVLGYSF